MNMATVASASAGLFYTHVPFDEPPNLAFSITALHHSRDELAVFLFGIAVLLRTERDHRKQVFDLGEYPRSIEPVIEIVLGWMSWKSAQAHEVRR
jgi:hypothetical protein